MNQAFCMPTGALAIAVLNQFSTVLVKFSISVYDIVYDWELSYSTTKALITGNFDLAFDLAFVPLVSTSAFDGNVRANFGPAMPGMKT